MYLFKTIYNFLNTFFKMLSYKTSPDKEKTYEDDNFEEYEFLVLNERR